MKKVQFTIDDETSALLESLAKPRAGNKSFVVREAVRRMADQEGFEEYLDWLEQQPRVRTSLERGLADVRAGHTVSSAKVPVPHKRRSRGGSFAGPTMPTPAPWLSPIANDKFSPTYF